MTSLGREVLASASEILGTLGLEVLSTRQLSTVPASWPHPVAVIGFDGTEVTGSLSISIPFSALARAHPTGSTERSDLLDWLREISNLLLGGVKKALLHRGLNVGTGIPASLDCRRITAHTASRGRVVHELQTREEKILIFFHARTMSRDATHDSTPAEPPISGTVLF